jgi:hypothetical protein
MSPEDTAILKGATEALEKSLEAFETWLEDGHNDRSLYQASLSLAAALQHVYASNPDLLSEANRARIGEKLRKEEGTAKTKSRFNTGF